MQRPRSLIALITLRFVFAYFFRKSFVERVVIVFSAIPIAIVVNAFRVTLTGILTHHFGQAATDGVLHTTEGLFTFAIAFLLPAPRRGLAAATLLAEPAPRAGSATA